LVAERDEDEAVDSDRNRRAIHRRSPAIVATWSMCPYEAAATNPTTSIAATSIVAGRPTGDAGGGGRRGFGRERGRRLASVRATRPVWLRYGRVRSGGGPSGRCDRNGGPGRCRWSSPRCFGLADQLVGGVAGLGVGQAEVVAVGAGQIHDRHDNPTPDSNAVPPNVVPLSQGFLHQRGGKRHLTWAERVMGGWWVPGMGRPACCTGC